jgi:hypothetical protein
MYGIFKPGEEIEAFRLGPGDRNNKDQRECPDRGFILSAGKLSSEGVLIFATQDLLSSRMLGLDPNSLQSLGFVSYNERFAMYWSPEEAVERIVE